MELLLSDVNDIQLRMIGVGAGLFIAGLLICVYISWKTTKPLGELVHELENVGKSEDETQKFEIRGWDEIHRICEECNYMTRRIRSLVTAIKESEKKKRAAEMGFLQSQMSPHFLYNTLFSIRCLVDMGDRARAIRIIDAFTSILKYTSPIRASLRISRRKSNSWRITRFCRNTDMEISFSCGLHASRSCIRKKWCV